MEIVIAPEEMLEEVIEFYNDIIDSQPYDRYGAGFTRGIYPSQDDLRNHIINRELYAGMLGDRIAVCGVLTYGEEEMYRQGHWKTRADDDEVAILHLFAVRKEYRRTGVSDEMLDYLLEQAGKHARVMHLDIMIGNLPAEKLYLKKGFTYAGRMQVFYEDTGEIEADLFEKTL